MTNSDAQVNCLVQWFQEWSELQRSDFLPIMARNYANKAYVNGFVSDTSNGNARNTPMSLFECRVKLFKEWYVQWSVQQKERFLSQISAIDQRFMDQLNEKVENGIDERHESP